MADMQYYEGLGRRKRAVARVRIYPEGDGKMLVNGKPYNEYFGRQKDWECAVAPFEVSNVAAQFNMTVLVKGGGITGQAEAIRMGIARALVKVDPEFRSALRKAGFMTRDSREKERKKPGLKRARKATQYTKR